MEKKMNLTNLVYVGNVSLRLKIKDKIISLSNHNKGLPALQRAFCNFLTGNLVHVEDETPQYIDVRYSTSLNGEYKDSILLNKLPLTGKSWEEGKYVYQDKTEETTYIAKLTAVLSSNSLISRIDSSDTDTFYRLYLQSGSSGTVNGKPSGYFDLAYLPISAETLGMVGPGTQAIIEWSLQLLTGVEDSDSENEV